MTASQLYDAPDLLPQVGYHYLAQQCSLTYYSRAGVRHSLSVAELLLRSLELADKPDLKREIAAILCTEVYLPDQPQAMLHKYSAAQAEKGVHAASEKLAAKYCELRHAVRLELRRFFNLDAVTSELQEAAETRIEIAVKLWFDEERTPKMQRKRDDEEWYRPYFEMERDEAYLSLWGCLESVRVGIPSPSTGSL
jgi:hypothetical protein